MSQDFQDVPSMAIYETKIKKLCIPTMFQLDSESKMAGANYFAKFSTMESQKRT